MNETPATSTGESWCLTGQTVGDYRVIRQLGRGGMAEVYLAEQMSLERHVALKVLRRELVVDEKYVRRFHNEARAVAALVHANIVQIYEVGCIDGIHFIAQEYVRGQTLKQLVSRSGPLDLPRAVSVLRQIAAALLKAAQTNIIHRDIKPENILLTAAGEVKVADFGLARVVDRADLNLTQDGVSMGTPLYMSPEQIGGKTLDHRSDLYSLGVTAFFMLAGRVPFEGDTPLAVAVQHLQSPPPDLRQSRADVPDELAAIVSKLLAKRPQDRHRSAAELLRDLRSLTIDGADYHLPLEADSLPDEEEATFPSGGLAATRQLQQLMDTQVFSRRSSRYMGRAFLLVLLGLAVGGAFAWANWSGPLLQPTDASSEQIEKKPTAEQQYIHAVLLDSEEALKAVPKFYPPQESPTNRLYSLKAKQQLALLYLDRGRYQDAYALFDQLAKLEETEQEFRAFGLAGQALIHDLRDETAQLADKLSAVWADLDRLEDRMREDVLRVARKRGLSLPETDRPSGGPPGPGGPGAG